MITNYRAAVDCLCSTQEEGMIIAKQLCNDSVHPLNSSSFRTKEYVGTVTPETKSPSYFSCEINTQANRTKSNR